MSRIKYPYYSPNLRFWDVVKSFFISEKEAQASIIEYFRRLTDKKHILLTNSCRTALYLSYQSLGVKGEIITSPLTCKVAIDPIEESGQKVVYSDISIHDLNISVSDIEHRVTEKTLAIQPIHLGGVPCEMDKITALVAKHNLKIIEDCAQSLGSTYKGKNVGSFGDVACFSLIKNAYGIGGGVFATNDEILYNKAYSLQQTYTPISKKMLIFRIIRNLVDTQRKNYLGKFLYKILMNAKRGRKSYDTVAGQLRKLSGLEIKIAAVQLAKYKNLHRKRKNIGTEYIRRLKSIKLIENTDFPYNDCSFTKLFVYHPEIQSSVHLQQMKEKGVESMHLEQSEGSPVQTRLVGYKEAQVQGLHNYNKVHDHLVSLPLCEWFTIQQINSVAKSLKQIISKK